MTKRVIFDTSFISRAIKTEIDIDAAFPKDYWRRIIHDRSLNELFPEDENSKIYRTQTLEFYKNNHLYTMKSSHIIILEEFLTDNAIQGLEKNEIFESHLLPFFNGKHRDQHKLENHHTKLKKQRENAGIDIFKKIETSNNEEVFISLKELEEVKEDLLKIIKEGGEWKIELYRNFQDMNDPAYDLILQGRLLSLIKIDIGSCCTKIKTRDIKDLTNQLPSLYMFLVLHSFLSKIKKPKSTTENASKFHIKLEGIEGHVKIEANTIADFQISLSGLHYCDAFATCDRAQAQFIKFLFPRYLSRIKFYENINGTYTVNSEEL